MQFSAENNSNNDEYQPTLQPFQSFAKPNRFLMVTMVTVTQP